MLDFKFPSSPPTSNLWKSW